MLVSSVENDNIKGNWTKASITIYVFKGEKRGIIALDKEEWIGN